MDKLIYIGNNGFEITENDDYLASALSDICRNNTAFPDIVDAYEYKKNVRTVNKEGKKETVKKTALRVSFADGSWTDVVKSDEDEDDRIVALLYAIVKRLFGTPTEGGYVIGDGFMNKVKKIVKGIRTDETDKELKEKRIKEKEEEDRKAHEEAVQRKKDKPSIGSRLASLEKNFSTLCEKLNGFLDKK